MEFKKCKRCGNFFLSNNDVCYSCSTKDEYEITKLKKFFELNDQSYSLEEISFNTGIKLSNLDRYMNKDEFKDISKKLNKSNNIDNLSINL